MHLIFIFIKQSWNAYLFHCSQEALANFIPAIICVEIRRFFFYRLDLTLMSTTTWAARYWTYSTICSRWTESEISRQAARNIQTVDITVLPLARQSWMSCKNSSIDNLSTDKIRWSTKQLFYCNTAIYSRSWVEK